MFPLFDMRSVFRDLVLRALARFALVALPIGLVIAIYMFAC